MNSLLQLFVTFLKIGAFTFGGGFINVTIDKYGNIVSVEDAGTQIAEGKDGKYIQAQTIFDKLIGKNIDTIDEVDAVSGATVSCEAIKSAVKAALS